MRRYLLLGLVIVAVCTAAGCPPTTGPGPNPPTVSWVLLDTTSSTTQTASGTVHVNGGTTYNLSFQANAPGGLSSMTLEGHGNPVCGADNGSGGIFTIGNQAVGFPLQTSNFNPPVTSGTLLIVPFNFFKIDCNITVQTDHGSKEAFALSGTITFTGKATDTSNRTSTSQLQVQVP